MILTEPSCLKKTGRVPESAVQALKEARAKGHLVFINTGRVYAHLGEIKKLVEADGYLCGCGTYILAEGQGHVQLPHSSMRGAGNQRAILMRADWTEPLRRRTESHPQVTVTYSKVEQMKASLRRSGLCV